MLYPLGGIVITVHFGSRRQLEKREYVAHARVEKHVHVGVGFLRRGHMVFGEG